MVGFMIHLGCMSLQASLIICVVLIIRKLFFIAHISKKYVMLLWIIPFFFLIFPWKVSLPAGFWNNAPADYEIGHLKQQVNIYDLTVPSEQTDQHEDKQKTAVKSKQSNVKDEEAFSEQEVLEAIAEKSASAHGEKKREEWISLSGILFLSGIVWEIGMILLVFHSVISYWSLKRKVRCSIHEKDCYYVDDIQVPMVLGIVKTRIYIPSGMEEQHLEYVIAHEKTHIKRKDPVIKVIAYFITCIHWFNPLVWFAYNFMVKDMEMACDEETIQRIGVGRKKEYATALLQLTAGKRKLFTVPLAFGEGDTEGRIKNLLHYKKTMKLSAIIAVAVGIVLAVVFLTKEENTLTPKETVQEEEELTFAMVRDALAEKTIDQLDFHDYTNGEEEYSDDENALNYYIYFFYEYEGEEYRLETSHSISSNVLEDIYITRLSDLEMSWLYTAERSTEKYPNDLETFLNTKPEIGDWLTLELPEGYTLESYTGSVGGSFISPMSYTDVSGDDTVPNEWRASGFVGKIENADEEFSFKNGNLQDSHFPKNNHSSFEEVEVLDYLDWPALMVHWYFDLYTGTQRAELEKEGVELTETESEYWYFYFVKEGEPDAYYVSLSAKEFSKKEAIKIAKTVKLKK